MKKKGLLFLVIGLTLVFATMFTACSLVKLNPDRQAGRVIATVSVDLAEKYGNEVKVLGNDWDYVVSLDITRRDLVYTINYAISYYSQLYSNYGLTYDYDAESLAESSLQSLKTQRYSMICSIGELLLSANETGRINSMYCLTEEYQSIYGKKLVPEGVFTIAERYATIKDTSEQFETRLSDYLKETEKGERDEEISNADNELTGFYKAGYFVSGVSLAYKDEQGDFQEGLYKVKVIDDAVEDTADLNYEKFYAKVKLVKSGADDQYVYIPIESTDLTLENDEGAASTPKYVTAKVATVKFNGRIAKEVTEKDDSGYEIETFTSKPYSYTLYSAKSNPVSEEEKESDDKLGELRYKTITEWAAISGEVLESDSEQVVAMKELKTDFFNAEPAEYKNNEEKDAYRRVRTYLTQAHIGYSMTEPAQGTDDYVNYKYYNGLRYFYEASFMSDILNIVKFEKNQKLTVNDIQASDLVEEYSYLVLKDKVNYDYLTKEEQVQKFFSQVKASSNGLADIYYVPIDALTSVTFEIDPKDKKYSSFFTFDEFGDVLTYNEDFVDCEENDDEVKYTMPYAYRNVDGTYTINMVYVGHILLSFDNVIGLADRYSNSTIGFDTEAVKMIFRERYSHEIETSPQKLSFLENYDSEEEYALGDLYEVNEQDEMIYQDFEETNEDIMTTLESYIGNGYGYEDLFNAFVELMERYNDDSGKLKSSGYIVSAGEVENGWYQDFTDTALQIYFNLLTSGKEIAWYDSTSDGTTLEDRVKNAYSDYGIHYMFLTFAPFYKINIDELGGIGLTTAINTDMDTIARSLSESMLATMRDNDYNDWTATFSKEEIEQHTTFNQKYYNNLLKDIKG